jgi:hypothetical protein
MVGKCGRESFWCNSHVPLEPNGGPSATCLASDSSAIEDSLLNLVVLGAVSNTISTTTCRLWFYSPDKLLPILRLVKATQSGPWVCTRGSMSRRQKKRCRTHKTTPYFGSFPATAGSGSVLSRLSMLSCVIVGRPLEFATQRNRYRENKSSSDYRAYFAQYKLRRYVGYEQISREHNDRCRKANATSNTQTVHICAFPYSVAMRAGVSLSRSLLRPPDGGAIVLIRRLTCWQRIHSARW